jgi:hypothetical protein
MLAVTKLIISSEGLATIILCWALGAGLIVTLALLNRRRIRSQDH